MDREAAGFARSGSAGSSVEADGARALAVDLDDEAPEVLRLGDRAVDLGGDLVARLAPRTAEERPRLVVREQLDEEVDVVPDARGGA